MRESMTWIFGTNKAAAILFGILALTAPTLVELVSRQRWPLALRRALSAALTIFFAATWVWMVFTANTSVPEGEHALLLFVRVFLALWLILGLVYIRGRWPRSEAQLQAMETREREARSRRRRKPKPAKPDARPLLAQAIAEAERELGLQAVGRVKVEEPAETVHRAELTRYADGTWFEYYYPADEEDGTPLYHFFAGSSNNKQLAKQLDKTLGKHGEVLWADKPVWDYPPTGQSAGEPSAEEPKV